VDGFFDDLSRLLQEQADHPLETTAMDANLTPDPLEPIRKEIDEADRQLIQILARRFNAVKRVGALKQAEADQPLLDTERERRVQASWIQDAEALGLSAPFARRVLKEILNHSRRMQESLIENRQGPGRRIRCGYQGQPGSYSALAASHLLAHRGTAETGLTGYGTFQEVGKALLHGEIDYGLLPVENSIGGSIADVNRLICDHSLHIVDEEIWQVEHVLAVPPGVEMADLRVIRSHPAALTQCETFLSSMEEVRREPWSDTATAAASLQEGVARERKDTGAICSEEAANLFGLDVIARSLADRECNETRFLLLAREPEPPDHRLPCKTSMLFRVNHHEGALVRALNVFAAARVNLTRIESRPLPDMPWEYLFFVDVEGHMQSPALAGALLNLRACCSHLRMLGSYPSRTRKQDGHLDLPSAAPAPVEAPVCIQEVPLDAPKPARTDRARSSVRIGQTVLGEGTFVLISGPCAVESLDQIVDAARMVRANGATMLRGGAFKPRTSPHAFQGLGMEGLRYLREAGRQFELPTVTEVLTIEDIPAVMEYADVLQVGARNMHNFALLKELGRVDKPVILKRGMSATVKELLLAAEYLLNGGNLQVILCERGIRTFETSTRATLDVSSVPVLKRLTHLPIIVDPSHAAGDRELVIPLALAAAAAGADGLIVEAHPRPAEALCDKEQALNPDDLARMTAALRPIVAAQGRIWN
jgi:chorismate mutase/prephenate dehydratase